MCVCWFSVEEYEYWGGSPVEPALKEVQQVIKAVNDLKTLAPKVFQFTEGDDGIQLGQEIVELVKGAENNKG